VDWTPSRRVLTGLGPGPSNGVDNRRQRCHRAHPAGTTVVGLGL